MSVLIRVSFDHPHELEAVETALEAAGLAPRTRQSKTQNGSHRRAYIRFSEHVFDKMEQACYNGDIDKEYPIP